MKSRKHLTLALLLIAGCSKLTPAPKQVTALWMDDIAYPSSGREFENAFVLEPGCRGLTFVRWTAASDKQRLEAMESPHWDVFYNGSDGVVSTFDIKTIRIEPYLVYVKNSSEYGFQGPHLSVEVKDAADAAKKACFVAKGKGGDGG